MSSNMLTTNIIYTIIYIITCQNIID